MQQLVANVQPSWLRLYCIITSPAAQKRSAAMLQPRGAAKFRKVAHMEVRCRRVGAWDRSLSVLGLTPQTHAPSSPPSFSTVSNATYLVRYEAVAVGLAPAAPVRGRRVEERAAGRLAEVG